MLLPIRNRPPRIRIRSRPEISWPSTVNHGAVSRMIQASENSSSMRVTIAPSRPSAARPRLLLVRQLARQDRDEDDVVDAEDDLEEGERGEGDPDLRVGQQVHHFLCTSKRISAKPPAS